MILIFHTKKYQKLPYIDYDMLESSKKVYHDMKWLPLHLRRQLHLSTYMYKVLNEESPPQFVEKFTYISGGSRDGENCNLYTNKSKSHKQFYYLGAKSWNIIPQPLRHAESAKHFSIKFKDELLSSIKADSAYSVDNTFDTLYKLHDKE